MRNAFLLITNTIGHAEEEWNTKVPPRGHQISKDTTLRPREAEGYPLRHWQPKVETSKSREGARIHQQGTQKRLRSSETTALSPNWARNQRRKRSANPANTTSS